MTTTPAGHFRDIVGDFIRKVVSEKDSEAHKVGFTLRLIVHNSIFGYLVQQIFRSYPGHAKGRKGAFEPQTVNPEEYVSDAISLEYRRRCWSFRQQGNCARCRPPRRDGRHLLHRSCHGQWFRVQQRRMGAWLCAKLFLVTLFISFRLPRLP